LETEWSFLEVMIFHAFDGESDEFPSRKESLIMSLGALNGCVSRV